MKLRLTIPVPDWLDRICAWPVLLYRKKRYGKTYRLIHLTDGKYTKVDQQDFYDLNKYDWCTMENDTSTYAVRLTRKPNKRTSIISMHREIMNAPKGLLVDHRNTNGLDNRRENLRLATRSENQYNKKKTKSNTSSQYLGVSFEKPRVKWDVRIAHRGKTLHIGRFDNEIDAARAYDKAAIKYHGEFARLNFPREDYINEFPMTDKKN